MNIVVVVVVVVVVGITRQEDVIERVNVDAAFSLLSIVVILQMFSLLVDLYETTRKQHSYDRCERLATLRPADGYSSPILFSPNGRLQYRCVSAGYRKFTFFFFAVKM